MSRSSSRHRREIQGEDSAGYLPPDFGEKGNDQSAPKLFPIPHAVVLKLGTIDMSVYVRGYGSALDAQFSLTGDVPSGTSIDPDTGVMTVTDAYGTYKGFNLVLTSSSGSDFQPITLDVYEEFYSNRLLTGGAESGPGNENPPTDHTFGFPNTAAAPIAPDDDGFVLWNFNPNEETSRIYLAQNFSNVLNPSVQVGDTFRIRVQVEKLSASGSGARAISISAATNITTLESKVNCTAVNEETECFYEFTVDSATWSFQFRFGLGTTAAGSENWRIGYPSLRNVL